jgi:hypothetical protein
LYLLVGSTKISRKTFKASRVQADRIRKAGKSICLQRMTPPISAAGSRMAALISPFIRQSVTTRASSFWNSSASISLTTLTWSICITKKLGGSASGRRGASKALPVGSPEFRQSSVEEARDGGPGRKGDYDQLVKRCTEKFARVPPPPPAGVAGVPPRDKLLSPCRLGLKPSCSSPWGSV